MATLAWNGYRHLELYFAVSGSGQVLHTINPRLHPDHIAWIVNHAEDQALFFDLTFLPLVEAIAPLCKTVKRWVVMTDRAHMPASASLSGLLCYEDLVEGSPIVSSGRSSTRTPHRRCATRRVPPEIPKVPCMRTARPSCIAWPQHCPTRSIYRHAT